MMAEQQMPEAKIRLHALARELGVDSQTIVGYCQTLDVQVTNHLSTIRQVDAEKVRALAVKISQSSTQTDESLPEPRPTDTTKVGGLAIATVGPATALFFIASFVSLFLNLAISFAIRFYQAQQPSLASQQSFSATVYVIALLVGVRHLFRLLLIDSYTTNGILPRKAPTLYWLILAGTVTGSISFTLSRIGATWYYIVAVVPYFALFVALGLTLVFRVTTVKGHDEKNAVLILVADLVSFFPVFELYQVGTGVQQGLGIEFWLCIIIWGIFFAVEIGKVYFTPLRLRFVEAGVLLGIRSDIGTTDG